MTIWNQIIIKWKERESDKFWSKKFFLNIIFEAKNLKKKSFEAKKLEAKKSEAKKFASNI